MVVIQAAETYSAIVNYEESIYNVRESYYIALLLARHSLRAKAERSVYGNFNVTRLAAVVYTFLLDYVKEDESKLLLLGYAIQSVSPLYYSWWIEKFGLPTAQYLRKEVPEALTEYDFGVWARVYQPEIEAATVLLAKRAD